MSDLKLGQILDDTAQRDAIHIAIAPVEATSILYAGQHVGLVEGTVDQVASTSPRKIGIIDPYLTVPVYPEQKCYLFLYPNTVTSLRHEWTHPAFGGEQPGLVADHKSESIKYLESVADRCNVTYRFLMECAESFIRTGDRTVQQGSEEWRDNFSEPKEFWRHFSLVTGIDVDDPDASIFCCTC